MATRWARVVRGLVAALVAVFVAGFAHVAGGGSVPGPAGAALAFSLCVPACILLAGRTLSTLRLAIAVGLSQGVFHVLFWMTGDSSSSILPGAAAGPARGMSGMAGMPGMGDASSVAGTGTVGGAGGSLALAAPIPESAWMWLAHLAAAAITVAALRRGEAAFWAFVAAARLTVVRIARAVATRPAGVRRASAAFFFVRLDRRDAPFLWSGLRHRGPPVVRAASF